MISLFLKDNSMTETKRKEIEKIQRARNAYPDLHSFSDETVLEMIKEMRIEKRKTDRWIERRMK